MTQANARLRKACPSDRAQAPCAITTLSLFQLNAFCKRRSRRRAVEKRQPPFAGRAGLGCRDPVHAGEWSRPPWPLASKERGIKGLDQVGDNRGLRRTVKEDNLVHRKRSAKPGLVDVAAPFGRRGVAERASEFELADSARPSIAAPKALPPGMRISTAPIKMVEFVGTDEVSDLSKPLDISAQLVAQPDRGPDPKPVPRNGTMTLRVG